MTMPNFTDLTGLASVASATAASVLRLPGVARLSKPRLSILLAAVFVLMLIPFGGMPFAAYLRGVTGDLSITTLILLWCAMLRPRFDRVPAGANHRFVLLILIALAAIALYPMALGVGAYDTYRLGYGNPQFIAVLLLIALAASFRKYPLIAFCIALSTLAWTIGWYESGNLWDYLLDPLLAIYALSILVIQVSKRLISRQRSD